MPITIIIIKKVDFFVLAASKRGLFTTGRGEVYRDYKHGGIA